MKVSHFVARVCVIATIVILTGSAGHQMENHCPNEQEILPCLCKSRGKNVLVSCRRSSLEELNIIFSVLAQRVSQVEELMLEDNDLPEIHADTFRNLPVQKLLLWNNGLVKMANQSFNGLGQHLTELHLRESRLREIPPGVFDSLISLEKLIIERTPLVQLPSLIFCQSLRALHIDETLVSEISHGAFVDLPRLKIVQITNSLLKNFQDRTILNLPVLELLNLTGNHLSNMNPSGWVQLPQLKIVDMRNNKLSEIYSILNLLRNFNKLKTLHLDYNQITNIDIAFEAFTFPELNTLTISHNLIEHFVNAQYKNWPSLRFFDLSFNQLSSLPLSLLAKTPLLEDLSLAGNPLMRSSFDIRISSVLSELPRLRLLNLDHCGIVKITQQTLGFHPVLEHLSLRNNSLRNIEAGAFHRLPSLVILNLSQNQLSNVPRDPRFSHTLSPVAALSGVFWHLEKLQSLDLSSNQLGNIDSTFFASLPSLRILNVSRNALTQIDSRVWTQMPSIDHLDMSHNSLNSLDGRMCKHLIYLERFIASFNQLSRVESGELHCPKLRFLDLSSNTIAVISDDAFSPQNALQFLDLSQNILPVVPNLNHLGFLRTISLASNWIDHLRSADFQGNLILDTINLSKNQIRQLPMEYFTNAHHLRNVDLSHNAILLLPANVFRNLMNLDKLDVSFNRITEVEADAFHPSTTLRSLNLAHNNISHLSNDGIDLEALQILDLQNNRISELSHFSVQKMRSLSELNLSSNQITTVNTKAFETSRALIKIDLSNNKIQTLSANAFSSLPNLQLLRLGRNQIERVEDDAFYDLISLESLELEENLIQRIAKDAFHGPSLLRMLNLSCNAIERIDDTGVNNFLSLEVLDLSFNRINEINGRSFRRLSRLLHLNMENNTICRLAEDSLKTQQKLRSLSLRNNRLRFLPESSLQQKDLLHLDLGGNPLNCDCQLLWLFEKSSIINRTTENYIFKQRKQDHNEPETKNPQLRLDLTPLDDFENCISLPRRLSRSICQSRELIESYDFCGSTITTESPQTTTLRPTVPTYNVPIPKSPVVIPNLHEILANNKTLSQLGNVPTVYAEIRKHNSSSTPPEKTVSTSSSLLGPLKIGLNFLPALIGVGSLVSGIMNKQGQQNKQEKDSTMKRTPLLPTSSASFKNPNLGVDKPTRGPDRHKLPWAQISSSDYIYPQYSTSTVIPPHSADLHDMVINRPIVQTRRPYIPLNLRSPQQIIFTEETLITSPPYDSGHWIPAPNPPKLFTPTSPMNQQTMHQESVLEVIPTTDNIKSIAIASSQTIDSTLSTEEYEDYLYSETDKGSDINSSSGEDVYHDIIDEQQTSGLSSPITTPIPIITENTSPEDIEADENNGAFSLQKLLSTLIQGRHTPLLPQAITTEGIVSLTSTTVEPPILKRDSAHFNSTSSSTESNLVPEEIFPADVQVTPKETHDDGLSVNDTLPERTDDTFVVSDEGFLDATDIKDLTIVSDDPKDSYKEWVPTLYEINSDLTDRSSKVAKSHAICLLHFKSHSFYSNPVLYVIFLVTYSSLTNPIFPMLY